MGSSVWVFISQHSKKIYIFWSLTWDLLESKDNITLVCYDKLRGDKMSGRQLLRLTSSWWRRVCMWYPCKESTEKIGILQPGQESIRRLDCARLTWFGCGGSDAIVVKTPSCLSIWYTKSLASVNPPIPFCRKVVLRKSFESRKSEVMSSSPQRKLKKGQATKNLII